MKDEMFAFECDGGLEHMVIFDETCLQWLKKVCKGSKNALWNIMTSQRDFHQRRELQEPTGKCLKVQITKIEMFELLKVSNLWL